MTTFPNGLNPQEPIPSNRFEVSSPAIYLAPVIIAVASTIILAIGAAILANYAYGTSAFLVGTACVSSSVVFYAIAGVVFYLSRAQHQRRALHEAKNLEEYKALLAKDVGVHYTFRMPDFVTQYYAQNLAKGADVEKLKKQAVLDSHRCLYKVNGQEIAPNQVLERFGDHTSLATQSAASDLLNLFMARYQCNPDGNVITYVTDRREKEKSTHFNLITEGTPILEIEQYFTIVALVSRQDSSPQAEPLKHLTGKIRIDLREGSAVATWSSPTNA
jgi:hypothetical protein